ncbi:MAG: class I SAM-dependent methyltransferase [Rothia sp. (in: high G+C Gram-positive bacteria)]|nr:class I SAM-dependent methyltransferase [Rothia sp. (in: high G+C Gram-positive bacteria)]
MANSSKYTHGHSPAVLSFHALRTAENSAAYLLPLLHKEQHLLDIGAGPGTITADFAKIVDRVTIIEISHEVITQSQQFFQDNSLTNAEFHVGDVHSFPFADEKFDVVHAHQVLQHVANPVQAFQEMARVCKPGGLVAVRDADYGGFIWSPEFPGLDEWREMYLSLAKSNGGDPCAGRKLLQWAHQAGLDGVSVTGACWTFSDEEERKSLSESWIARTEGSHGQQALEKSITTPWGMARMVNAWKSWGDDKDAWFLMPHGEVIWRKPS